MCEGVSDPGRSSVYMCRFRNNSVAKRPDLKGVLKGVRAGGPQVRVGIALVLKCAHNQVIDSLTLAGVQYTLVHALRSG